MAREAKVVGVMGGMGPAATVEFLRRLVEQTRAEHDQDHLHVVVDSDPRIPPRSEAILRGGEDPTQALCTMARRLEGAGAEMLVLPCNTAHYYLRAIRAAVEVPVLDMIGEAARRIPSGRTGLLATTATIRIGLFVQACSACGLEVLVPDEEDQRAVMEIVDAIKAGVEAGSLNDRLSGIASRLVERGAESILVGCTEISLVGCAVESVPWIDALDCLIDATLREAGAERREERE
jgi:aspartate racemase